jgi:hypothetical protein
MESWRSIGTFGNAGLLEEHLPGYQLSPNIHPATEPKIWSGLDYSYNAQLIPFLNPRCGAAKLLL